MAVADYLLEFKGPKLKGESQDDQYKDSIEIDSWSWSGHNASTHHHGHGGGAGKVSVGDLQLNKSIVDFATATLFHKLCSGQHFDEAILHCRKKAGEKPVEYLTITMKTVTVSSLSLGGHGTATGVSESASLAFEGLEFKYTQQNKDGTKGASTSASYNVSTHKLEAA